jgi:mono/diheme cytochrome c family protein
MRRLLARTAMAIVVIVAMLSALVVWRNFRDEAPIDDRTGAFSFTAEQVERGEYLARAGNCVACHTMRGGAPYAGGLGVATPFGTIYSSNITPDAKTGIGTWNAGHFWRAMHNGRSKEGRLLYPAFPYPSYTQITREDSDAIFAYLMSLPAVAQLRPAHALRFPYDSQLALAVWRALFFEPGTFEPESRQSAEWNRGAYLVRGPGHCVACHSRRNVFGAVSESMELSGGVVPMTGWYAPSLLSEREAGVADWDSEHVVAFLATGVSPNGSAMGPMAEVVFRSTQYLTRDDLRAMAVFLKTLPQAESAPVPAQPRGAVLPSPDAGRTIYERECADCHGKDGKGAAGAYPALAGNRAVMMNVPANVIRVVLSGGYLPATRGNPRPFGMPPFAHVLNDADIAAVVSYVRGAWGNDAAPVTQLQVSRYRQ